MAQLTPRQAAFVREYLLDLNATQAAIRAGYSPDTSKQQGQRLLTNVDVQAAINAGKEKRAAKLDLKAEDVLLELRAIGFADPDAEETPHAEDELDPGPFGGALKRKRGSSLRYEHKLKALELLGKHLALFTEKHELAGPGGEKLTINIVSLAGGDE